MLYQSMQPISREEAEAIFNSNDQDKIGETLVRVVYHDPDWRWVQSQCIRFTHEGDIDNHKTAITCLGHIARLHRAIDLDIVLPLLDELKQNADLAGIVEDAVADIRRFAV